MAQAAVAEGVAGEIGASRVVLARLLVAEEEDPVRLAHAVARVAGVTLRAVQAQQGMEPSAADIMQGTLREVLQAIDEEDKRKQGRRVLAARALPAVAGREEDEGWEESE